MIGYFSEKMTFKQNVHEGSEPCGYLGKGASGRENKGESLEMRVCLDSSRNSKKLGYLEGSEKEDKT